MTTLLMALTLMTPALALEYNISEPSGGMFANETSVDPVIVVGGGPTERDNIDRSKNVSVVPPPFGSPASYLPGTGTALTPSSSAWSSPTTPSTTASAGSASSGTVYYPPAEAAADGTADITVSTGSTSTPFTLPDNLFYADGSLGTLKIPKLDLSVKVYENESLESLAKGVGHFKSTSCWDGNVGLAGHNRGLANHFGNIHKLKTGDKIIYTTKLGTRTYKVFFVGQVEETDFSHLGRTSDNIITLVTCVRDVRNMRWCVQGAEVK